MSFKEKKRASYSFMTKSLITLTGIALGFLLSRFFFVTYTTSDSSMLPNIKRGERVLILKHFSPNVGDIVLLKSPTEPDRVLLKRLIAKEDDSVEIKNKLVYKNNKIMKFDWKTRSKDKRIFPVSFTNRDNLSETKIGSDEFFVLGDNLDSSFDSRDFGLVDKKNIIGKFVYIIW